MVDNDNVYRIHSIRRCGYNFISSPEFVWHLLIPIAAREAIRREKWSIDTTELGDSGPFADVEEG